MEGRRKEGRNEGEGRKEGRETDRKQILDPSHVRLRMRIVA